MPWITLHTEVDIYEQLNAKLVLLMSLICPKASIIPYLCFIGPGIGYLHKQT